MNEANSQLTENSASLPPKRHILKKIFKIIVYIIGFLLILYLLFLFVIPKLLGIFWGKDDPTVNDIDLQLQAVLIPQEQNSYYDLIKITGTSLDPVSILKIPEEIKLYTDYLQSDSWDEQKTVQLLTDNQTAMQYFYDAYLKDKFLQPDHSDPDKIPEYPSILPLNFLRDVARLYYVKAVWLIKQGKDTEAFESALVPIKIGYLLESAPSDSLIIYLVGIAIHKTGIEAVQKLISLTTLEPKELSLYINEIKKYPAQDASSFFKTEYFYNIKNNLVILKEDVKKELSKNVNNIDFNNFYYKPNQTLNLYAQHTRKMIENNMKPCNIKIETEKDRLAPVSYKLYFTENAIGKLLYDMSNVSLNNVRDKKCEIDNMEAVAELTASIKEYVSDKNDYPQTLNDLIPGYLVAIPDDPFSGQALKYNKDKKIIYSVGSDFEDSGGLVNATSTIKEPTFSIDFIVKKLEKSATSTIENNVKSSTIDTDGDGLTDSEELIYGTNINSPDTDGDGFKDGDEVKNGFNPNGAGKLIN